MILMDVKTHVPFIISSRKDGERKICQGKCGNGAFVLTSERNVWRRTDKNDPMIRQKMKKVRTLLLYAQFLAIKYSVDSPFFCGANEIKRPQTRWPSYLRAFSRKFKFSFAWTAKVKL